MNRHVFKISFLFFILLLTNLIVQAKVNKHYEFPDEEQYLLIVDKIPTVIGGVESIMKKISYPPTAAKNHVEGKVYLLLFINENGEVDDVKVIKGIGSGCDEEAIKVVKYSKFSPGSIKGLPVKSKVSLAINFKLP